MMAHICELGTQEAKREEFLQSKTRLDCSTRESLAQKKQIEEYFETPDSFYDTNKDCGETLPSEGPQSLTLLGGSFCTIGVFLGERQRCRIIPS